MKGAAWEESDVDVAVLLSKSSWDRLSKLMSKIASALELSEDRVDIIDLSKADVVLKREIIVQGIKLVDRRNYEDRIREELCAKLPEALDILSFYLSESGNPLKREIIAAKLMAMDEEIRVLQRYVLGRPAKQVVEDPLLKRVLRDSLRVAIESAIDICKHVVASLKLGVVRKLSDFPAKLVEAELMSKELAGRLADYAKLRNVIVHRYVELDYGLLHEKATEFVEKVVPEFEKFAKQLG